MAATATRHLGAADWRVDQLHSFAGDRVFLAASDRGRMVLKMADPRGLAAEEAVCRLVREHGVPAPEILALELDDDQVGPHIVMRHVDGEPVGPTAPVLRAVGVHLRVVHEIEMSGFGGLGASGSPTLRGPSPSWAVAMEDRVAGLGPLSAAGLLPEVVVAETGEVLGRHRDVLEDVTKPCLLHGDIHPRHVYAQAGRLTGIIDWGDAAAGDPLFDLGRILRADPRSLALVLDGYGGLPYTGEDLSRRLHLYALLFTVHAAVAEFSAGAPWPAWFEGAAAAMAGDLEVL